MLCPILGDEDTRASHATFVSVKSAANSFGSREKLSSGPPCERSSITCFSIMDAPVATLVKAVVLSCV